MPITAIIGTYDDVFLCNPMGNGKSMTMVYFGYNDFQNFKNKIFANFSVRIPGARKMQILDMVDEVLTEDSHGYSLLLDEIQLLIASEGLKMNIKKKFVNQLVAQSRKRDCRIYYTTQRYRNVAKSLRDVTTFIIWPVKRHIHDGVLQAADLRYICNDDVCPLQHQIEVYRHYPFSPYPLVILDPVAVGKLYNTDEIVMERTA